MDKLQYCVDKPEGVAHGFMNTLPSVSSSHAWWAELTCIIVTHSLPYVPHEVAQGDGLRLLIIIMGVIHIYM